MSFRDNRAYIGIVWKKGDRCACFSSCSPLVRAKCARLGDGAWLRWDTGAHACTRVSRCCCGGLILKSLKSWESSRRGKAEGSYMQALRFQPGWRRRGCVALGWGCCWRSGGSGLFRPASNEPQTDGTKPETVVTVPPQQKRNIVNYISSNC